MGPKKHSSICYLCGEPIGRDRTRDHVPPQCFFPPELRRQKNFSRLDVLSAHSRCNSAFQLDEQYFFHSLAPLARRTEAGPSIWGVIDKPILTPGEFRLRQQISGEFRVASTGEIRKTFDRTRIERVIRKIIRGLWFLHYSSVMPEEWRLATSIHDPDNPPPGDLMAAVKDEPSWGHYPEVFFFKCTRSKTPPLSAWMFFFWDWFVVVATVHETGCSCFKCKGMESSPAV